MFRVEIRVEPHPGSLDPAAEAIDQSIARLGVAGVRVTTVGRYAVLEIDAAEAAAARAVAEGLATRLLVNPNLEVFHITVAAQA